VDTEAHAAAHGPLSYRLQYEEPREGAVREILMISAVTACVSFTVSDSALFSGFRRVATRAHPQAGKLASCGYCLGHWLALTLVLALRPDPGWGKDGSAPFLSFPLTVLLVAWLAGAQWAAMCWLFARAGK